MRRLLLKVTMLFFMVLYTLNVHAQYDYAYNLQDSVYLTPTFEGIQEIIINFPSHGSLKSIDVNGDEFYLKYTPVGGFTGRDTFSIEYLNHDYDLTYHHFIVDTRASLIFAENDFIRVFRGSDYLHMDVLENDSLTAGPGSLKNISNIYGAYSYISNDSLFVKPQPNFVGMASMSYHLCDTFSTCERATLNMLVIDSSMLVNDTTLRLQMSENSSINFFLNSDAGIIVDDANHGITSYIYQNNGINYKPFQNYFGSDTIVIEDPNYTSTVIIEVIDLPHRNTFVVDDYVYVHPKDEVVFNVFDNDIVSNAGISYFSTPNHGVLTKLSGGNFRFVPDSLFMGTTTFEYIVCLPAGGVCETGEVTIFVDELNPDKSLLYELTTAKNRAFVINYDVPLINFNFDVITYPSDGLLEIFDGKDTIQIGCEQVIGNNMVLYTPDTDYIGQDTFKLKYCVGGNCTSIDIFMDVVDKSQDSVCACLDDCVWPGDMNADGRVNMKDLLSLGYNIGESGLVRPYGKNDWFGQYAPDWNMRYHTYDVDLKHLDADGDGTLATKDTVSIAQYYGLQNTILPKPVRFKQPYPISLKYVGPPNPQIGDLVSFDIIVGNQNYPATQLEGFVFSLDVDPNVVDTSTINVRYDKNSFLTYLNATMDMQVRQGRRINMGLSRTDREAMSGYGRIATLDFVIEDEVDGIATGREYPLTIKLLDVAHLESSGEIFNLPGMQETIMIPLSRDSQKEEFSKIRIHPNPLSSGGTIYAQMLGVGNMYDATLFNINGAKISTHQFAQNGTRSTDFTLGNIAPGMYILQFNTDHGMMTEKIVVQ